MSDIEARTTSFSAPKRDHCRRQHHDVGGRARCAFVGHGAPAPNSSSMSRPVSALNLDCEARHQTLGRAAA